MKKLIAISFLSLHLFSQFGHFALYKYFIYQSDKLFNEQISKNKYKIDDLVEIKVPVATQVVKNWTDFEQVSGQVQFKSTCYNYVKIKLTRDTIYLMCIPNYEKTRLFTENIINAKQIADIPVNKKEHVPFGKIVGLAMYNYPVIQYNFKAPVTAFHKTIYHIPANITKPYLTSPGQPPDTSLLFS